MSVLVNSPVDCDEHLVKDECIWALYSEDAVHCGGESVTAVEAGSSVLTTMYSCHGSQDTKKDAESLSQQQS